MTAPVTAPRRWRPSVLYVVCALVAIALILVWLFSRPLEPSGPAIPPPHGPASSPAR